MSYLIDTNVISEIKNKMPDDNVTRWFQSRSNSELFISVLTLGEIHAGIERLEAGPRKEALREWLEEDLRTWFQDRLLPIDELVAQHWGHLIATTKRKLPAVDSLLAATALTHRLRIVTRNEKDFVDTGVEVINPWLRA